MAALLQLVKLFLGCQNKIKEEMTRKRFETESLEPDVMSAIGITKATETSEVQIS